MVEWKQREVIVPFAKELLRVWFAPLVGGKWRGRFALLGWFVGVLFTWLAWGYWGAPYAMNNLCAEGCDKLGQVGDLFGGVNALFAGFAFCGLVFSIDLSRRATDQERQRSHDKEVFEQVCKSYSWAFETLSNGTEEGPPLRDRLRWLNTARHLLRAKRLSAEIETPTYQLLQKENLEYWRFKFHDLLHHGELARADFYGRENPGTGELEHNIHYASVAAIAEFLIWTEEDPIDDFDVHQALETNGFRGSYIGRGLEAYLVRTSPRFVEEHQRRKARPVSSPRSP